MTNEEKAKYRGWIDACLNESKKRLTKFEEEFLASVDDDLDRTGYLSERRIEILEQIYTEKT